MKSTLLAAAVLTAAFGAVSSSSAADVAFDGFVPGGARGVADYRFEPVMAMPNALGFHSATLLDSGQVLLAGGRTSDETLATTPLLYDPVLRNWTPTGALGEARASHAAVRLASGKVLAFGGLGDSGALASAELYDPVAASWAPTGALATPRVSFAEAMLADGRVLAIGGNNFQDNSGNVLAGVEIYDPASGRWSATAPLAEARMSHTATTLASGKVLVLGGYSSVQNAALASAEIYDPASGSWSAAAPMPQARLVHTATRLPSGKVLVVGGSLAPFEPGANSAVLYDPASDSWQSTPNLEYGRGSHTASLLPSGKVLVAGGGSALEMGPTGSSELYDPDAGASGAWSPGPALTTRRFAHVDTVLASGEVLLSGGLMPVSNTVFIGEGDLFTDLGSATASVDPAALTFRLEAGASASRALTIANTGAATTTLTYAAVEAPADCADLGDVAWLGASPASGSAVGGSSGVVEVRVDAGALDVGTYSAWLCLSTNDATQPRLPLPVQVVVEPAADSIFRSGFEAVQPLRDPGFEASLIEPPFWSASDSQGGDRSVLFQLGSLQAHSGNGYVQFGSRFVGDLVQSVTQSVVIPSGARLNYWRLISWPPEGLAATMTVRIDGQVVETTDLLGSEIGAEYQARSVDPGAYADGAAHQLEIRYEYTVDPAGWPSDGAILIDDVTIDPAP